MITNTEMNRLRQKKKSITRETEGTETARKGEARCDDYSQYSV